MSMLTATSPKNNSPHPQNGAESRHQAMNLTDDLDADIYKPRWLLIALINLLALGFVLFGLVFSDLNIPLGFSPVSDINRVSEFYSLPTVRLDSGHCAFSHMSKCTPRS
jgi:hypothetical protein